MASTSRVYILMTFVSVWWCSGCSYSFTGAAIQPGVETVTIRKFDNTATLVTPTLAQNLTEALRDKFISQTSLKLRDREGDLQLSGSITDYNVTPLTITGGDQAAQNRLKIAVRAKFVNVRFPDNNWEQSFEQFVDFPSTQTLNSVEAQLIREIQDKLVQDIFNKALSNW